ncbi:MAG TPA: endonuclease III [Dehalococcoidia bacterium]|nr:endonuclease III [Dehalococcoidia bacterium]
MKDAAEVIRRLEREYPDARIALNYSTPLELLVAVVLSAQCTDEAVNKITQGLFEKYRTAEDYAGADREHLEQDIKSTGFYHSKAKSLIGAAASIVADFGGEVPRTMAELTSLPGVGRKTANIVLYNAFGITDGIAVDTHVKRLSGRIGFTANSEPEKIERDLMEQIPRAIWGGFSYLLIEHGRAICIARKPKCGYCMLKDICQWELKDRFSG